MRDALRLGFILFAICAITAGALSYVNGMTKPMIAKTKEKILQESLNKAFPAASSFKILQQGSKQKANDKADVQTIYEAFTENQLKGYVAEVNSKGYGGPIHMLVGIDLRGSVEGVEIVDQTETPGLGTQVKKAGFSRQFRGFDKSGDVKVTKDGGRVQAITGATISSRAVSAGVAAGIDAIKNLPETR